jgi:hypothetical protein
MAFVATQPSGSAGGLTLSKLCPNTGKPPHPSGASSLFTIHEVVEHSVIKAATEIANLMTPVTERLYHLVIAG